MKCQCRKLCEAVMIIIRDGYDVPSWFKASCLSVRQLVADPTKEPDLVVRLKLDSSE